MGTKHGVLEYRSTEIDYTILPSGNMAEITPMMTKFLARRYDYPNIPINERARRALFTVDTNLFFDPRADIGDDPVEPPVRYPKSRIDKRYE